MAHEDRTVGTQAELDAALAEKVCCIKITSPAGTWLEVSDTDSSTVTASDSSTVRASDSSTVRASKRSAVHKHSKRAKITGGVIIDHTDVDLSTAAAWLDDHGVDIADGHVTIYKAVNADLRSDHGFDYPIGAEVVAPDWRPDGDCGGGLHFGPTPTHAEAYCKAFPVRYLACRVAVADLIPIVNGFGTANCKARAATVLYEVDMVGRPIAPSEAAGMSEWKPSKGELVKITRCALRTAATKARR